MFKHKTSAVTLVLSVIALAQLSTGVPCHARESNNQAGSDPKKPSVVQKLKAKLGLKSAAPAPAAASDAVLTVLSNHNLRPLIGRLGGLQNRDLVHLASTCRTLHQAILDQDAITTLAPSPNAQARDLKAVSDGASALPGLYSRAKRIYVAPGYPQLEQLSLNSTPQSVTEFDLPPEAVDRLNSVGAIQALARATEFTFHLDECEMFFKEAGSRRSIPWAIHGWRDLLQKHASDALTQTDAELAYESALYAEELLDLSDCLSPHWKAKLVSSPRCHSRFKNVTSLALPYTLISTYSLTYPFRILEKLKELAQLPNVRTVRVFRDEPPTFSSQMISREATRKLTELLDHEKLTLFPHVSTLIVDQAADLAPGFLRQFPGVRRLTLKNAVSQNMADHPNSQGLVQLLSAAQGMPLEFASIDYEPRNWINTIPGEAYQIPLDLLPQSLRHLVLTVPQSRMDYLFNIGEGISRHHRQLARLEIKSVQDESSLQELLMGLGEHPSLEHLSLNFSGVVWYGKMSKALVRQGIDSFIAQLLNKPRLRTLELTVRVHKEYLDEGLGPFEPMRRWRTFMEEEFQRLKGELREAKVHATVKFKFYEEPK